MPTTPREQPRDYADPEVREEMEQRRDERRKAREAQLDTNHDGVVSPEERRERFRPMLDRFDTNHDGKLTVEEFASSEHRMISDPAAMDTDHDGVISLQEIDTAMTQRREQLRAQWRGRHGGGSGSDGPD